MTVEELIELLEDLIDAGQGDRELRFVYQANYPLQDTLSGVWENDEFVYLVSGGQDSYGPSEAFAYLRGSDTPPQSSI